MNVTASPAVARHLANIARDEGLPLTDVTDAFEQALSSAGDHLRDRELVAVHASHVSRATPIGIGDYHALFHVTGDPGVHVDAVLDRRAVDRLHMPVDPNMLVPSDRLHARVAQLTDDQLQLLRNQQLIDRAHAPDDIVVQVRLSLLEEVVNIDEGLRLDRHLLNPTAATLQATSHLYRAHDRYTAHMHCERARMREQIPRRNHDVAHAHRHLPPGLEPPGRDAPDRER